VVTKPFHFEGQRRMRFAEAGITELLQQGDTLLVIPNQNLFRVANEKPRLPMLSPWPIKCFIRVSPALD
jgi:cell division GTPase FtsZ